MSASLYFSMLLFVMTAIAPVFSWQKTEPAQGAAQQGGSAEEKAVNEDAEETTTAETPPEKTDTEPAVDVPAIRPRLALRIESLERLVSEAQRSRSGVFLGRLRDILSEMFAASAETLDPEEAAELLSMVGEWPDTAVDFFTYAPDTEGRSRWLVRIDWPFEDFYGRVRELLESDAGKTVFENLHIGRISDGSAELSLENESLGVLGRAGAGSILATHAGLEFPEPRTESDDADTEADEKQPDVPLLSARLSLTGTEQDTGATFLSRFSAITAIDYNARVNEAREWVESVRVHWPPISGMGIKMFLARVKRTFFVPDEAFGALVINASMAPGMLDGMAGFGPQVMMAEPGRMEIVGEAMPGPVARHLESTVSVVVLPGTGFLPMPDIVIQGRAVSADRFADNMRKAIAEANRLFREREQPEPWHETTVRDRAVFYSDGGGGPRGLFVPVVMRPVVFLTREHDARERERDYLVVAFTSTSPQGLVRRWLDFPRTTNMRYLPAGGRNDGQLWLDVNRVYQWVHPYLNVSLSATGVRSLLPYADEVKDHLHDAMVTGKVGFTGLTVSHRGPVPAGSLVLPAMISSSLQAGRSGSDLARERLATQRLRALFHHCSLFHQDYGRWPAEIRELDGYIDFAGNPYLLRLELSSRQRWKDWFEGIFKTDDEEKPDDEDTDDEDKEIDDSLFVIKWGRESWKLGIAPGRLEHLAELYIDQNGNIHRVPRTEPVAAREPSHDRETASKKKDAPSPTPTDPEEPESADETPSRDRQGAEPSPEDGREDS